MGKVPVTPEFMGEPTGANQVGVFGTSDAGHGLRGVSQTGYGVYGTSDSGTGIVAGSTIGAPFRIVPGNQPTSGTRVVGEMYADTAGNLWFYNGTAWKKAVLA